MSYAAGHPVYCARREDLGCKASHPGSRWDAVKADGAGWFHGKAEEQAYCPEHVPGWVPAWRARQRQGRRKVRQTFERAPVTVSCAEGDLSESLEIPDDEREAAEALRFLRARAHDHAYRTGHTVNVTTAQMMVFEPYCEEAAARA